MTIEIGFNQIGYKAPNPAPAGNDRRWLKRGRSHTEFVADEVTYELMDPYDVRTDFDVIGGVLDSTAISIQEALKR